MEYLLIQFASTEAGESGLFTSLGISWGQLGLQLLAFLLLLVVLRKWVYPPLVAMLDKRDEELRSSAEAAMAAKQEAEAAEEKTAQLLKEARKEAAGIVATAKTEAASLVEAAESKAKAKSESILASAREDITKEIAAARDELRNEMVDLVTLATEKVVGTHVSADIDAKLIKEAVKESGR